MNQTDKNSDTADKVNDREWPNTVCTRDDLDSALEAGLKSGRSDRTVHEIFEERIDKFKNG